MNGRAQASVELLLVLVVSMVILLFLVQFTTDQTNSLKRDFSVKDAQQNMSYLIDQINLVYSQGVGSSIQVSIVWPDGIDASSSGINDRSIILNVFGSDIFGTAIPLLSGSIPTTPGKHSVLLSVTDEGVTIGLLLIESSSAGIYQPMARDSNQSFTLVLTNKSTRDANFTVDLVWNHSLVNAVASPSSGVISGGGTQNIVIDFGSTVSALGNYVGELRIGAVAGSQNQTLLIPVDVEVFSGSGLLTVFPSSLSYSLFSGDSNGLNVQVCNSGETPMKSVSFTPSQGDAGNWVGGITSLNEILPDSCETVLVSLNVPSETSIGSYSGNIVVLDFSGVNNTIVPFFVDVQGMNDIFSWDWDTAVFSGTTIQGHTLENTGDRSISVSEITLSKWWSCDLDHSFVTRAIMDGNSVFSGSKGDGNVLNVSDFSIAGGNSISNNSFSFDNNISDEGEQFLGVVSFLDGSSYTTSTIGSGCPPDITSPSPVTDLNASKGTAFKSILVSWTYPGDDNSLGVVSSSVFKRSTSPITSMTEFNNATAVNFSGPYLQGGNSGTLTDVNLTVGTTYYYAVIFWDEADNNSGLSNTSGSVPQNSPGGAGGGGR